MKANSTAEERLKERESELLPKLQDPEKAAAEEFVEKFLIPHFKNPEVIAGGKKLSKGIIINEWDCPGKAPYYPYDTVRSAVKIAREHGFEAKERIRGDNRSCYFSKQY